MSDFETVRDALDFGDDTTSEMVALSRIEAELTRLRKENERLAVEHHGDTDILHVSRLSQQAMYDERDRLRKVEEAARAVWETPGFAGAVPQATIERLRAALSEEVIEHRPNRQRPTS